MARPTKKFESGGVSAAVWSNEIETDNGPRMVDRVTVERRYKDQATGEWKSTGSFKESELPKVILVLQKAYEFMAFKKRSNDEEDGGLK